MMVRVLFISMLFTACPCQAETPQKAVDKATAAFIGGQYEESLRLFRRIRQLEKDPERRLICQWNIARSLENLGRLDEAITVFEAYRKAVKDPVRLARADGKIKTLRAKLTGSIAVSCDRSDAVVTLEGRDMPALPCPAVFENVMVGPHIVNGRLTDGTEGRAMATVVSNRTVSAQILFGPAPVKETKASSAWMWYVGGGVALAAAGVITYVLLSNGSSNREYETSVCFETDC